MDQLDMFRQADPDESQPWGGRSPRVLTRAYQKFNLEPLGDDVNGFSPEEDAKIEEQYRRFHYGS